MEFKYTRSDFNNLTYMLIVISLMILAYFEGRIDGMNNYRAAVQAWNSFVYGIFDNPTYSRIYGEWLQDTEEQRRLMQWGFNVSEGDTVNKLG